MRMKLAGAWRRLGKRRTVLIVSVCLVLAAAAGLTVAWLTAESALMTNGFQKSSVTCGIEEAFDGHVKSHVAIRNTGDITAYIRAALVPVWKDGGNVAGAAVSPSDYSITMGDGFGTEWVLGADGYYYCVSPVPAGETTPVLIESCTVSVNNGYAFELQIAAQAVQAAPASAVEVWGCGVDDDGNLEVPQ